MLKKYKYYIIIVLIIVVVAYFIIKNKKQKSTEVLFTNTAEVKNSNALPPIEMDNFPLKNGSKGANVKRLQIALNRLKPTTKIVEDGYFGNGTRVKIISDLATSLYSVGPSITELQLNKLIQLGNNA